MTNCENIKRNVKRLLKYTSVVRGLGINAVMNINKKIHVILLTSIYTDKLKKVSMLLC